MSNCLLTVIVTHFNYAEHVEAALRSVLQQTHANFECIVVDDCSSPQQVVRLREIIRDLKDGRIRLIELDENRGQTNAVFVALAEASGEFVSLLDPDDLYEPKFLEKMLLCHLNPCVYAPVAACEMGLFRHGGQCVTRAYVGFKQSAIQTGTLPKAEASLMDFGFSTYYPPSLGGWLWGTTSSMMFRRDALLLLRQKSFMPELKICADTYCVTGCHILGGTLFVDELLSWRGLHNANAVEIDRQFSLHQHRHQASFVDHSQKIKASAVHAILDNGGLAMLKPAVFGQTLRAQFTTAQLRDILAGRDGVALELYLGSAAAVPADMASTSPVALRSLTVLAPEKGSLHQGD